MLTLTTVAWAQGTTFNPTTPADPGMTGYLRVSVSPKEAGTATGGGVFTYNTSHTVSTTAASSDWIFKGWVNKETGSVLSTSTSYSYKIAGQEAELVATYVNVESDEYQQTLNDKKLVLITEPENVGASLSGAGSYDVSKSVYVRAYSATHWTFRNWTNKRTGAVVSSSMSFYFTKTAKADTLVANYTYSPVTPSDPAVPSLPSKPSKDEPVVYYHTLTVAPNIADGGTTSISSTSLAEGASTTVRATAKTNYTFIGWRQDNKIVATTASYSVTMGTEDMELTAMFLFTPPVPDDPEGIEEPEPEEPVEPEPEPEVPTGPSTLLGDVNGDHVVDMNDVAMTQTYVITKKQPEGFIFANGDINKDKRITGYDMAMIMQIIKGHEDNIKEKE